MNFFGSSKGKKRGKHFSLLGTVTGAAKEVEDDVVKPLTRVTKKVSSKVTRLQQNGDMRDNDQIFNSINIARGRKSRRRKSRRNRRTTRRYRK